MDLQHRNKSIHVPGAGRGLGGAIGLLLAVESVKVVLTDMDMDAEQNSGQPTLAVQPSGSTAASSPASDNIHP